MSLVDEVSELDVPTLMNSLLRKIELTAGARFEAARRHKKRNRTSNVSIIVLSLYAILFSLITTYISIKSQNVKELLNMLSLFMSVLIVAFSLFEASKRHDHRGETFLHCAQDLKRLADEVRVCLVSSVNKSDLLKKLSEFSLRYHEIISRNNDNHSELDLNVHFYNKSSSKNLIKSFKMSLIKALNIWIMPIIALISPAVLFLLVVFGRFCYEYYLKLFQIP